MEERKVWTLEEIRRTKFICFEQLKEEARRYSKGDKNKQLYYMTTKTIVGLRSKVIQENMDGRKLGKQSEDQGGKLLKNQKKRKLHDSYEQQQEQSDMPIEYKNNIEEKMGAKATDIKLVISKHLYASEFKRQQNRFSIPFIQVLAKDFLTDDEEDELRKRDEYGKCVGLDVVFIDPSFEVRTDICLKRWQVGVSGSYSLIKGWFRMIQENKELKKGTNVELWSFRVKGQLGFQLIIKD